MHDVPAQLQSYFDDVVERITEEDIRIRATTERGIPVPSARFRPRPLAAGAMGFGLAMTLLGMVLVVDRVFGAGTSDAGTGSGGGTGVLPGSEHGSAWLFIPVVIGLGLLATGIISARRHNGDMRKRGGITMQTIEKVEESTAPFDDETLKLKKRTRWLGWLAGILAVAVVGLGVWLIAEVTSGDGASLPDEAQLVLDDYAAAWENHDRDAFIATTTDDYQFVSNGRAFSRSQQSASISYPGLFRVEVNERMVEGDGPYYVAQSSTVYVGDTPHPGQSTLVIAEIDGAWKVQLHQWAGDI